MRKELDEVLVAKYPTIFQNRHADPSKTCMYWGFDCGDGWYNIIEAMCSDITNHIRNERFNIDLVNKWNTKLAEAEANNFEDWEEWKPREYREVPEPIQDVIAIQVKEKFGGLRFYYSGGDDYIRGIVSMAECMSYRTCEVCGSPGTSNNEGWIRTLCEEHRKG